MSERAKETVKAPEVKANKASDRSRQPYGSTSPTSPHEHVIHLQNTIGNQAVQRLFKAGMIQAKLKIGPPNDIYEQEADRVADQVMRMSDEAVSGQPSAVSEGDSRIQMKPG